MPSPRLHAAAAAVSLLAVLLLPGGPVAAAPPGAPDCPETRPQLAGQRFTTADKLPALACADLHGAIFDGVDLDQADLTGADAHGASFRHTHLTQATLTGADLRDAHFEHADLVQADLGGADARGAFFGDATLDQADLDGADLRGADLLSASLIQTDLTDADLRGAKSYWAVSIQADVSGARVDLTDPRNFQFSLLAVLAGLILLVRSALAAARLRRGGPETPDTGAGMLLMMATRSRAAAGDTGGGSAIRKGVARLVLFGVVGGFVWLLGGMLFPLLFIDVLYPALAAALLVFLSGVVRGYRPRRTTPETAAFAPPASVVNPWS